MQVKRVQKYVETLDAIKLKNAAPKWNHDQQINEAPPPVRAAAAAPTHWEQFDLLSSMPSTSSAATAAPFPRFDWDLF